MKNAIQRAHHAPASAAADKATVAACLDYCIAARLSLAECATYLNQQGVQTATGQPFTLASLSTALTELGVLPVLEPKEKLLGKGTNE